MILTTVEKEGSVVNLNETLMGEILKSLYFRVEFQGATAKRSFIFK